MQQEKIVRTRAFAALALFFMTLPAWGATSAESAVLAAQSQRFRAQVDGNFAALEQLLADDLTYTHSSGLRQTKAEYLNGLRSGGTVYKRVEAGTSKVQINGPVAVVTGKASVSINIRGADSDADLIYTEVQVYRDGRWQLLTWHSNTPRVAQATASSSATQ